MFKANLSKFKANLSRQVNQQAMFKANLSKQINQQAMLKANLETIIIPRTQSTQKIP